MSQRARVSGRTRPDPGSLALCVPAYPETLWPLYVPPLALWLFVSLPTQRHSGSQALCPAEAGHKEAPEEAVPRSVSNIRNYAHANMYCQGISTSISISLSIYHLSIPVSVSITTPISMCMYTYFGAGAEEGHEEAPAQQQQHAHAQARPQEREVPSRLCVCVCVCA